MGRPRGAGDRLTLDQALKAWQTSKEDVWRTKTKVTNSTAVAHLEPLLQVRIDRLTPEAVKEVTDLLGPHTGRQAVNAVKGALKLAQSRGYEIVPETVKMRPPSPPNKQQRALTRAEVELVAKTIGTPHGDIVRLLAYTGLRVGELAGLEVRDFDSTRNRITVRRGVSWARGPARVGETKTFAGQRSIPLVASVREIIESRIRNRSEDIAGIYSPIILGPRGGKRWNPQNWRRDAKWTSTLKELGLGHVRLHDLRHTYASLARRSGADPYVLQKVMGHKSISTTLDIYGHLYDDEIDDLGAALNRALGDDHGQNMA